jgi:dipeptidase
VPECFATGNGDMLTYSPTAAFWLFNRVTNFAYSRYNAISADIIKVQREFEAESARIVNRTIAQAHELADPTLQVAMLTELSVKRAETLMQRWQQLDSYLLVKYIDGNIKREKDGAFGAFERTPYGACPSPEQPQLPEKFRRAIVNDNGETLKEWK